MASSRSKAVVLILLASLSFAIMAVMVRLAGELPSPQKVLFRNLVSLFIAYAIARGKGDPLFGRRGHRRWLLLRGIFGMLGVLCYFYAIDHLLLADAAMLNRIAPFFVTLIAWLTLGERIEKGEIPALLLAFAGALLVIKPRFDFNLLPALIGLASALFAGSAYVVVRYLGPRESTSTIVFVFSLVTIVGMGPLTAMDFVMPEGMQWLALLGIGLGAAGGQYGLTAAHRHEKASRVAIYTYVMILYTALLGLVIFGELPDLWSISGGLLILAGGYLAWRSKLRQDRADAASPPARPGLG